MISVELSKIIIDEKRQDQIIVLKEKEGKRQLPIVIGLLEASSIKMELSNYQPPRPMTHDLIVATINELGAEVKMLLIDKMVDNTFHAKLLLIDRDNNEKEIDTRPSDGVAIAVRTDSDIFVEEDVLEKASIFKDI